MRYAPCELLRLRYVGHMKFGNNMKRLRLAHGWTQEQAARRMGKTQNDWSLWETGKRMPGCATMIQRIADALKADVGELFK